MVRRLGRTELHWLFLSAFKRLKIKGRKEFRGDIFAAIGGVRIEGGAEPNLWGKGG